MTSPMPRCVRTAVDSYGKEVWEKLEICVKILYKETDNRRQVALELIRKCKQYFVQGGPFYQALQRESKCVHHSLQFALSDLHDEDFQVECSHEHTEGDVMVGQLDDLFEILLEDAVLLYKNLNKETFVTITGNQ